MQGISDIQVNFMVLLAGVAGALVVGYLIGYYLRKIFAELKMKEAEELRRKIIEEAEKEAKTLKKSAQVELREEKIALSTKFKKEMEPQWVELRDHEKGIREKETKFNLLIERNREVERSFDGRRREVDDKEKSVVEQKSKYEGLIAEEVKKLETIGSYTAEEAREGNRRNDGENAAVDGDPDQDLLFHPTTPRSPFAGSRRISASPRGDPSS